MLKRFILLVIIFILIFGLIPLNASEDNCITITKIEGRVEKEVDSWFLNLFQIKSWHQIKRGDKLEPGDKIRTDSRGKLEFYFSNGIYIKVAPDSEIIIGENKITYLGTASSLKLNNGRIWVKVKDAWQEITKFEVITPSAIAGVKGTLFSVFVQDKTTLLSVKEGEVEFKTIDRHQEVFVESGKMSIAQPERVIPPVKIDKKEEKNWDALDVKEWKNNVNKPSDKEDVKNKDDDNETNKNNDDVIKDMIKQDDDKTNAGDVKNEENYGHRKDNLHREDNDQENNNNNEREEDESGD